MAMYFAKNCCLMRDRDPFCLVCTCYFHGEKDALAHIKKPEHKENLDYTCYLEKYENHYIRKLKHFCFCEVCNLTIPFSYPVAEHVKTETHLNNLKYKTAKRNIEHVRDSIILQNRILLSENAWNSFIADYCVVCSTRCEDFSVHKNKEAHITNRVRSTVNIDGDNIYRDIDDGHHCLNCNKLVADTPETSLMDHFKTSRHKKSVVRLDQSQNE